MELAHILRPVHAISAAVLRLSLRIDFMQQQVAAFRELQQRGARRAVTRNDDGTVWCIDAITEGLRPGAMMDGNGRDLQSAIAINNSRFYLVNGDFVTGFVAVLQAVDANIDILLPGCLHMIHHSFGAGRAKQVQRRGSPEHPRREDKIRKAKRMVGVQMSKKNAIEPWSGESRDAVDPRGGSSAADYSGTGIKQVRLIVQNDGDCRT